MPELIKETLAIFGSDMEWIGSLKEGKGLSLVTAIGEAAALPAEKVEDWLYYAPAIRKFRPLHEEAEKRIRDVDKIKVKLQPYKKIAGSNLLVVSALYRLPRNTINYLQLQIDSVCEKVEKFDRSSLLKEEEGLTPFIYEKGKAFYIGWMKTDHITQFFKMKLAPLSQLDLLVADDSVEATAIKPSREIVSDTFINNINEWVIGDTKYLTTYIAQSHYQIKGNHGIGRVLWKDQLSPGQNCIIEAEIIFIGGPKNQMFGLYWYRDEAKSSLFGINAMGKYSVAHYDKTLTSEPVGWKYIMPPTADKKIKRDKKHNVLKIHRDNDCLLFYINNHLVYEYEYDKLQMRRIGFFVNAGIKIGVKYFNIKRLSVTT
jgi:hypothetical protein